MKNLHQLNLILRTSWFSASRYVILFLLLILFPLHLSGSDLEISIDNKGGTGFSKNSPDTEISNNKTLTAVYISDSTEVYGLENFSQQSTKEGKTLKNYASHVNDTRSGNQPMADTPKNKDRTLSKVSVQKFATSPNDVFFHGAYALSSVGVVTGHDHSFHTIAYSIFYTRYLFYIEKRRLFGISNRSRQFEKRGLLYLRPPPMPLSVT